MSYTTNIKQYYANNNISNFYKEIWGGDNIHIGIYDEELSLNEVNIDYIKKCSNKKSELMCRLVNMYTDNLKDLNIADFGAGFGGTSRYIKKSLCKTINIDCYDLSKENCVINTNKNIVDKLNIGVYNLSIEKIPVIINYYNVIISEDAFIHIENKDNIFKEINRVLLNSGFLIMSDIVLTNEAQNIINYNKTNDLNLQEVYDRIKINKIDSEESYKILAKKHNLILCNTLEYKENMLKHYEYIKYLTENNLEKSDDYDKILDGLNNWIKHIKLGNITWKIFIFKKNLFYN